MEEQTKLKYRIVRFVDVSDWDDLVKKSYGRPYSFQQQDGCQSRGIFNLEIPSEDSEDEYMHDSISEVVNGDRMGVKFKVWLARDPKQPLINQSYSGALNLFWKRNFYPDINTVANDLYNKGLIEAGDYIINIDW